MWCVLRALPGLAGLPREAKLSQDVLSSYFLEVTSDGSVGTRSWAELSCRALCTPPVVSSGQLRSHHGEELRDQGYLSILTWLLSARNLFLFEYHSFQSLKKLCSIQECIPNPTLSFVGSGFASIRGCSLPIPSLHSCTVSMSVTPSFPISLLFFQTLRAWVTSLTHPVNTFPSGFLLSFCDEEIFTVRLQRGACSRVGSHYICP